MQWLGGPESDLPPPPPGPGLTPTAAPAGPPGPPPPASSTQGDIPNVADQRSLGRKMAIEWKLGQNKEIHPDDLTNTRCLRWRWVGECQRCGISEVSEWGIGDVARIPGWSSKHCWCPACMGNDVSEQEPHPEASQPPPPPGPPPPKPPDPAGLTSIQLGPSAGTAGLPAPPAEPPGVPPAAAAWLAAATARKQQQQPSGVPPNGLQD